MRTAPPSRLALLCLCLIVGLGAGCDGDGGTDAGPPDAGPPTGVGLTVDDAQLRDAILGVSPRAGNRYLLLDVTLQTRDDAISVAPVAFEVELEDRTRVRGDADRTNAMEDGCRSQMVASDSTLACRVAFVVAEGASAPRTLRWADATRSASAAVPPLE